MLLVIGKHGFLNSAVVNDSMSLEIHWTDIIPNFDIMT